MLNGCCVKGCPGKQTGTQQGNNLEKSFHQAILILGRRESYLAHLLPRSRCPGNPPVLGLCLLCWLVVATLAAGKSAWTVELIFVNAA